MKTTKKKTRTLRPKIVCWHKEWEWIVGIKVPEKFASPNVIQNGESIKPHDSDEACYSLRYIKGIVKVTWNEGEQDREIKIPVMEDGRSYLIFKMRKNWKGLGRVVRRPTAGYYLAIVPCEWKRDEEMSGSAPIAPENVQISGYKAHFFALRQNENTSIAFIDANGGRISVKSGSSSFQLIGKELERLKEEEKEREARLEKQHELERQLRKARRDVFSEDRVIAGQAEKDIKRLKEELWPYYEPQYNKAYGSMMNHLLSATD